MGKRYYWLKLHDNFFDDPKIKKLRRIAGGDTFTIIYLKMQLLSVSNGGIIAYQGIEETFEEELSLILDEDIDNIRITVSYLLSQNLMEQCDNGEFLLTQAAENVGKDSDSKERVRAYRERKALRESIPLVLVERVTNEMIRLPDGSTKYIDNKRYGGNAEYVYELAECKCEICGETDPKKLLIHHNNGYSNDLEDLFLLCKSCHSDVESGYKKCVSHKRKCVTCNICVTESNTEKEKELDADKEKEQEQEKNKVRKRPTRAFVPPTVEEVEEYARSRNSNIDPKRFWEYYNAGDWKDAKGQPVKSWKQRFITWEGRENGNRTGIDQRSNGNDCPQNQPTKRLKNAFDYLDEIRAGANDSRPVEQGAGDIDWDDLFGVP